MNNAISALQGKTAVVIGGSRGLGRGVVEALAGAGARVLVISRDEARLAALAREVAGTRYFAGDSADENLARKTLREESPDVVVLCAGAAPMLAPFHEQSWEDFSLNWQVDTRSAFVWLREAIRTPMRSGSHFVVISSGAAVHGSPVSGGYAGAKRTQWFLADYAAQESERNHLGLHIHCILPSLNPSTELGRAAIDAYARRTGVTPEEYAKRFGPPLTPAIFGGAVAEIVTTPERWSQLTYRVTGAGLAPHP
jgi:NAD(P)-dependent dehydrogenase (short-subunit alcohol dehydrogenase family)